MSKFFKPKSILVALIVAVTAFSCSSDDNSDITIPPPGDDDPVATFDAELFVSEEGGDTREVTVLADGSTGMEITSKISFLTVTENMRRLYITEQVNGGTPEPFQFTSQEVDEKPDGSLDLVGDDKKDFNFQINLPAPMAEGESIVYTFWATTGRGDFRDVTKRNAIAEDDVTAVGTIIVNFGTPTMSDENVITEYNLQLDAPLLSGNSQSFASLYNGMLFKISDGQETASLWDFGYYYGATNEASLASTSNYPSIFDKDGDGTPESNVAAFTDVPQAELNDFFISTSSLDYDTVSVAEIDAITASTTEAVTQLAVGNVLEFVDAYGNKGIIRIEEISGTFNSGDFMRISIKASL